jgi:hypothetical protein
MLTRSQSRFASATAATAALEKKTLSVPQAEEDSFEIRRSKRLQELGHIASEQALRVTEWLNAANTTAQDYDSDNDSTSTYNTTDADAEYNHNDHFLSSEFYDYDLEQEDAEPAAHNYNTRSSAKRIYEVEIDFDEASRAWRANKRRVGEGHFQYFCPCSNQRNTAPRNTRNREGVQTRSMSIAK